MAKVAFTNLEDDELSSGALYVVAPNENAYILIAGGVTSEWEYAQPGIDLIAQSLVFEEEMITVVMAGDEPLPYGDPDEAVELMVPAGWYAMSTGDVQFPVIIAEPEVRYVAAIGTIDTFGGEFDPALLEEFVPETGELAADLHDELIGELMNALTSSGSPMALAADLSEVFPREGAVTTRLVGEAELGDGLGIPVMIYIDLRHTDVAVVAFFGDIESALTLEDVITTLIESVTGL